MTLAATHQFVLSKTIAATATYTLSANGRVALSTIEGGMYIPMGALATINSNEHSPRFRGLELEIASSAAANQTGACKVWLFTPSGADREIASKPTDGTVILLGTLSYTIGAATGIASSPSVTDSFRFADTMAWVAATDGTSPKGISSQIDAVYGASVPADEYSPADDTIARLFVPDVGNCDVFLDWSDTSGVTVKACVRLVV